MARVRSRWVSALTVEVVGHGTNHNHNILSRYCRITAKHTPVTAEFEENVIRILRDYTASAPVQHSIPNI